MSTDTQRIVEICEQLPESKRAEVIDFATFLLTKLLDRSAAIDQFDRWLDRATGAATSGLTTDQIMALTRGER